MGRRIPRPNVTRGVGGLVGRLRQFARIARGDNKEEVKRFLEERRMQPSHSARPNPDELPVPDPCLPLSPPCSYSPPGYGDNLQITSHVGCELVTQGVPFGVDGAQQTSQSQGGDLITAQFTNDPDPDDDPQTPAQWVTCRVQGGGGAVEKASPNPGQYSPGGSPWSIPESEGLIVNTLDGNGVWVRIVTYKTADWDFTEGEPQPGAQPTDWSNAIKLKACPAA